MAALADLIAQFSARERPVGTVLADDVLQALAEAACRKYTGYAALASLEWTITPTTDITVSEWALIWPLFLLYVERENALYLEATRGLGLDVYGRSVSEITSDISAYELELPHLAFVRKILTV